MLHARITDDSQFLETHRIRPAVRHILFTPDWNYNLGGTYRLPLFDGLIRSTSRLESSGKGKRMGSGVAPA